LLKIGKSLNLNDNSVRPKLRLIKKKHYPNYITALALQKVDRVEQLLSFSRQIDEANEAKTKTQVKPGQSPRRIRVRALLSKITEPQREKSRELLELQQG
jgi:hypothetical protein